MRRLFSNKMKNLLSSVARKTSESVEFDQEYWDALYGSGRWSFLHNLPELAHYSILVGYCHFFSPNGSYLEIGCGEGILQQRLKVLDYNLYTGIDISQVAINKAVKFSDDRTDFVCCSALEFNDSYIYDIIIFNESLYCFNNCIDVLKFFSKKIEKNGIFIISMHVQSVSVEQWKEIDDNFKVIDSVFIENNNKVKWICKAIGGGDDFRNVI